LDVTHAFSEGIGTITAVSHKPTRLLQEIDSRACPFEIPGNSASALLIHGFTGTCAEMIPIGQVLSKEFGWRISAPLLPGHGTTISDLEKSQWAEWMQTVETSFQKLKAEKRPIHLVGLSMGALLCLELFRRNPTEFESLALLVPPIRLRTWYQRTMSQIARVSWAAAMIPPAKKRTPPHPDHVAYTHYSAKATGQFAELVLRAQSLEAMKSPPTFICYSDTDEVVHPNSAKFLMDRLQNPNNKLLHLKKSSHVVTIESEKDILLNAMTEFYRSIMTSASANSAKVSA
jgi:carboxylesterase